MHLETPWQTRLFVILAHAAPVAAIPRRGPCTQVQLIRQNTFTPVEPGGEALLW